MRVTRRDFGRMAAAGVPAIGGWIAAPFEQRAAGPVAGQNRSLINGVQFGLQPFCYHDLAMTRENRPTLIKRLVENGMGMVELHATWCEPRFDGPGIADETARAKLREWRLNPPPGYYAAIRKDFDAAGISIFTYYVNLNDSHTDAEVDATFAAAKLLGARGCIGSQGLRLSKRLAAFPGKHGMFLGLHNHANLSDPDALCTEASFVTGLGYSPDVRATLDVR